MIDLLIEVTGQRSEWWRHSVWGFWGSAPTAATPVGITGLGLSDPVYRRGGNIRYKAGRLRRADALLSMAGLHDRQHRGHAMIPCQHAQRRTPRSSGLTSPSKPHARPIYGHNIPVGGRTMLRPQQSRISALSAAVTALPEAEVYSVNGGLGDRKGRLKFLFTEDHDEKNSLFLEEKGYHRSHGGYE